MYDGLGSVVGEVDVNGTLTSSPKYDVYGLVRQNPGSASSAMGFVGGLGHLSEASTGLIYMRARYYDPALGRFASEDPSKNGYNWYIYCDNSPNNKTDISGEVPSVGALTEMFLQLGSQAAVKMLSHHFGWNDGGTAETIRKEMASEIKGGFSRTSYLVQRNNKDEAEEDSTDGMDPIPIADQIDTGASLIDEAQNVGNIVEDMSVLDYLEGSEGMDGDGI